MDILEKKWINLDQLVKLIVNKESFIILLKDIKQNYIVNRGITEDELQCKYLWWWIQAIDDIISKMDNLEEARKAYMEELAKKEEEKIKNQLAKK